MSWLWHWISWTWGGKTPGQGAGYAIFSGPLPDVTMLGIAGAFYRKHACHTQRCWRLSWKAFVDSGGHTHALCKKHHPHDPPTAEQVRAMAEVHTPDATGG